MMTGPPSQSPTLRRSWANVVKNKSITLYEEEDYEEARRARQAETILARALNTNAVIFDFGTNIPSKAEAYRTIKQIGPILGARIISRSRNPKALLIEVRYEDDKHRDQAIDVGVTYDNITYRATRALTLDAEITKVNFSSLPFLPQEAIRQGLEETMSLYSKVCQIRLYVEPETETFEGEATVILDRSPPAGAMQSDDKPHYLPLTRFIPIERWGELYPASWKNAPPVCRYCNKEGHRKDTCPKMQDITCFYCHKPSHFRRNCSELRKAKTLQEMNQLSDSQLLETYPSTNQPEEDHDNSTNDQHTDSASQPATDDQHMTDSNVNRDSTTTIAISTSDNILNQHTSSQPIDNDHNMLDNNDDDQYIRTTKKQKTASATSLRITRSMSQHIQQSQ